MVQVSQLSKEERFKEIYMDVNKKTTNPKIDTCILTQIIESIEDKVYFISDSPVAKFKGRNYN